MAAKIEFTAKNAKAFSTWLKKFAAIDQSLLLEVDESHSLFLAKTYNEERSVVKFSQIKFDEAGFTVKTSKDPKRVKVGIYNIARLMKIIDQFNDEEFSFTINYDELTGDLSEWAGTTLILKNKTLKMTVECTSLNIFKYIDDNKFKQIIAQLDEEEGVIGKFNLNESEITKTNQLCSLDSEHKFMEFVYGNNIVVSGKTFDLTLGENSENTSEGSINIFKEQFESVDIEDYLVVMRDDRLVFESDDKNTVVVISMVEKD